MQIYSSLSLRVRVLWVRGGGGALPALDLRHLLAQPFSSAASIAAKQNAPGPFVSGQLKHTSIWIFSTLSRVCRRNVFAAVYMHLMRL